MSPGLFRTPMASGSTSRLLIEPHTDGNWSLEALEKQTERAMVKLVTQYPKGKYEIVFTFDHITIHTKLPPDALRVTQMAGLESWWRQRR